MRVPVLLLALLFLIYIILLPSFTTYMNAKPYEEKLGYLPQKEIVGCLAADHRQFVGFALMMKVIFYFGGILEKQENALALPADYYAMARYLRTANFLDPYNEDVYYFAQATYSDTKNGAKFINELLDEGIKYRTWDPELPFFAGFNEAFTLKDYKKAAEYMKKAGNITGDPFYNSLAAKFFNEAGETELGILFMAGMEKNAKDDKIRRLYRGRKNLLIAVKDIKHAVNLYRDRFHVLPRNIDELSKAGLLTRIPRDPFGGKFYITREGKVESTSKSLSLGID